MPLRPGDIVSLSIRPSIPLARYNILKPSATLTRTLGDAPDEDVRDMRIELRRLFLAAVHDDLTMQGDLTELIRSDGSTAAIAAYALKHSKIHVETSKKDRPTRRPHGRL